MMAENTCNPLISIVVLAYNCEKFITKCLDSLANQDCPEKNYEVYITDDGSTDQTGKITAGILEALREKIGQLDAGNVQLPAMKEVPALTA